MGCQLTEEEGSLLYLFQSNYFKIQLATLLAQCAGLRCWSQGCKPLDISFCSDSVPHHALLLLTRHSYQSPAAGDTLILQIVWWSGNVKQFNNLATYTPPPPSPPPSPPPPPSSVISKFVLNSISSYCTYSQFCLYLALLSISIA